MEGRLFQQAGRELLLQAEKRKQWVGGREGGGEAGAAASTRPSASASNAPSLPTKPLQRTPPLHLPPPLPHTTAAHPQTQRSIDLQCLFRPCQLLLHVPIPPTN